MTRVALLALLAGCTPPVARLTPEHPASPDAPAGRLAGPPAALRPGVVEVTKDLPAPGPEATPAHTGHEGH